MAFYIQVSIQLLLLAGSIAPTPLYAVYQAAWGFSPITVTMVFGVYAVAVLAALLVFGSLSDYVGRRPVLIAATALSALTMLLFAHANGVAMLLVARVIQGLATGSAVGALGAGLLDLNKARGTVANSVAPMMGSATGALGASLMVQYLPAPTQLVFFVIFVGFVLQAVGVFFIPETATRKPGALASLKPRFGIPMAARRPFLVAAPALVAVWALIGFYGSLGPALVRLVAHSDSFVLGGLAMFVLAASAALTVLVLQRTAPRSMMLLGTTALLVGVGVSLLATVRGSTLLFLLGTAVAGVGVGGGFQGALRTVVPLAAPHERAGVLSAIFVLCYLAMGLPAVSAGVLTVYGGGVLMAGREYGLAVMVLTALALLGMVWPRRAQPARPAMFSPCPSLRLASEPR
jgi:MFS family permease